MGPERLEELAREHREELGRRLYRAFSWADWELAEDAAQQAFLKLCQQPTEPPYPLGWLFLTGARELRNLTRWRRRRPEDTGISPEAWAIFRGDSPSALDRVLVDERLAWLRQAIAKLTPRQQAAVQGMLTEATHGERYGKGRLPRAETAAREKAMRNLRRAAARQFAA